MTPVFTSEGVGLLKVLEGCALRAYPDSGGIWTIGYGSTFLVREGMEITQEEADSRLSHDIGITVNGVLALLGEKVRAKLSDSQFTAFCLFAFNIRGWQFVPLTAMLRAGRFSEMPEHWLRYTKVTMPNGQKAEVRGLKNRREREVALFTRTSPSSSSPNGPAGSPGAPATPLES